MQFVQLKYWSQISCVILHRLWTQFYKEPPDGPLNSPCDAFFFTHFTQNEREDEEVRRWIWPTMKTRLDAPSGPCLFIGKGGGGESLPVLTAPLTSEPISWALQPGTGSPILPPDGLFSRRWVPRRHLLKEEKHSGIVSKARCLARQNWRNEETYLDQVLSIGKKRERVVGETLNACLFIALVKKIYGKMFISAWKVSHWCLRIDRYDLWYYLPDTLEMWRETWADLAQPGAFFGHNADLDCSVKWSDSFDTTKRKVSSIQQPPQQPPWCWRWTGRCSLRVKGTSRSSENI